MPLLRERLGRRTCSRSRSSSAGQAWLAGGAGTVAFGSGEAMILAATLLWAVEVILVKRLVDRLRAADARGGTDGAGCGRCSSAWLAVSGRVGDLLALGAAQWGWALLTGLLLTAYVATWYAALARAQAVDVTAVLVFGAVVTALLPGAADGMPLDAVRARARHAPGPRVAAVASLRRPVARGAPS